jgi:hypothetical protein
VFQIIYVSFKCTHVVSKGYNWREHCVKANSSSQWVLGQFVLAALRFDKNLWTQSEELIQAQAIDYGTQVIFTNNPDWCQDGGVSIDSFAILRGI